MNFTDKFKGNVQSTNSGGGNISFLKSIKGKLMLFFLLVGLIPALVIGLISYNSGANSIKSETYDKLDFVQKIKAGQIEN